MTHIYSSAAAKYTQPVPSVMLHVQTSAHANPDVAAVTFQSCTSAQRTTVTYSQLLDQIKVPPAPTSPNTPLNYSCARLQLEP